MKVFVALFVVFTCFSAVSASCWGGRSSENVTSTSLDTCCWMADDTCCAAAGTVGDLTDIQDSLKQLVRAGLSQNCYLELANLECSLCSPNQAEYITYGGHADGDDTDDDFDNQRYVFRICTSFCHDIWKHCKNTGDAAILGANTESTETEFCETMNGQNLIADKDGVSSIFGGATWVVSQFSCYEGVSRSVISESTDVCLTSYDALQVVTLESSSASVVSLSAFVAIVAMIFT